jgi:hypothetical protein
MKGRGSQSKGDFSIGFAVSRSRDLLRRLSASMRPTMRATCSPNASWSTSSSQDSRWTRTVRRLGGTAGAAPPDARRVDAFCSSRFSSALASMSRFVAALTVGCAGSRASSSRSGFLQLRRPVGAVVHAGIIAQMKGAGGGARWLRLGGRRRNYIGACSKDWTSRSSRRSIPSAASSPCMRPCTCHKRPHFCARTPGRSRASSNQPICRSVVWSSKLLRVTSPGAREAKRGRRSTVTMLGPPGGACSSRGGTAGHHSSGPRCPIHTTAHLIALDLGAASAAGLTKKCRPRSWPASDRPAQV